ncbi:MAG: nitroreductase family protein [Lachnospiraceae bacterium]|nr:nitroreductase family protein [Lachnospiraceae bacterium]
MEAITCIKTRRSIRKFKEGVVEQDTLEKIVEAASYVPSWKNTQITRYHVIQNKELINKIAAECFEGFAHNTEIVSGADNLVVVSMITGRCGFERDGSYSTKKGDRWQMFDAGAATQTFCLAAHEYGIGTVVLGIFDEDKVAEIIDLEEGQQVAALVAMGYPAVEPSAPPRKGVDTLMRIYE